MKTLISKLNVISDSNVDYKKVASKTAVALFRFAMLIAVGYTVLSPLFQIISNSLKSDADFMNSSVVWIPTKAFFQNYAIMERIT